jgi:hypothetical protein
MILKLNKATKEGDQFVVVFFIMRHRKYRPEVINEREIPLIRIYLFGLFGYSFLIPFASKSYSTKTKGPGRKESGRRIG